MTGERGYFVYILASRKYGALYVGVTGDLVRRVFEHRTSATRGFTRDYRISSLVYFERLETPSAAITREKQIKKWRREWRIRLIETDNPRWIDLFDEIARWP